MSYPNPQRSEPNYREIVDSADVIIVTMDLNGVITYVNAYAERFFGFPSHEILGQHVVGTIVPEFESSSGRDLAELMKGILTEPTAYGENENENMTRDGRRVFVHWRNRIVVDSAGRPQGVLCIGHDVTDRRKSEAALRQSSQYARSLIEASPDPLVAISIDGQITDVNQATENITGLSRGQMVGTNFCRYFTEPERARIAYQRVLVENGVTDFPLSIRHSSGKVTEVLYNASIYRNDAGAIAGVLASARDVTKHEAAQRALFAQKNQLEAILNATTESVFHIDCDGIILAVNKTAAQRIQKDPEAILGSSVFDYFPPEAAARRRACVAKVVATGEVLNVEDQREDRFFALNYYPIVGRDNRTESIVVFGTDISERKHIQQRLEHLLSVQKAMLENDLIGIVTVKDRKIVWANPAFEKMLGYEPGELTGTPTRTNYPSDEAYQAFGASVYPALADGKLVRSQIEHVRKDGRRIWVDISGSNLSMDTGETLWGFLDITEHKLLEDTITQNEQRMELALAGADLGLWDLDIPSGRFTYNPRLSEMLGYANGEIDGDLTTLARLLYPDDQMHLREAFFAHLKGTTSFFEDEHRLRHTSDRWVWVYARGKVIERDAEGRAVRIVGTSMDISQRKHDEGLLKARETRLATLISSMQDLVFVLNTSGQVVEYFKPPVTSSSSHRGYEEVIGKTYAEIFPREVASAFDDAIAAILMDGQSQRFEYTDVVGDQVFVSMATVSPLIEDRRYPTGFLVVVRDVSTERAAQKDLERLHHSHSLLLESMGEGIFGVDLDYGMTFVNAAAVSMLGYSEGDLLGHDQHSLFHHHRNDGSPYPVEHCPIRLTLADGQIRRDEEEWFWRKDGSGFPVAMTVTPVLEGGTRVGAVVIFQDISERKANEAKVRELAFYDPLTHLPNRRLLLDRLGIALPASARSDSYGAILYLDLDNFKVLNDTKGHEFGDLLLIEVARRLLSCVRAKDTVARLGGDEFVVMLEDLRPEQNLALEQATVIGEKIRCLLSEAYVLPGHEHQGSSSIGICMFKGADVPTGELLRQADLAMYQAKAGGRNALRIH